ncbi:hypothetical protein D6C90_03594 [Aureobasidium pullulans]|uniref:Uncharacterized protein n=1 Tax=Aureobasidium pullulans TaxID=5580 RepID=A0A4V6TID1_AURPU|nr:hypothetical protein D6C90_03594 [Aureobasidium pullulans]
MSAQRPIYVSPNPETTKRDAFTEFFLKRPCPQEADPKYKHLFDVHQNLMRMLINDSAMDANRQQTFSTPANSKNKVYFMWDFVTRTFQMLVATVNPRNPSGEAWMDIATRSMLAQQLILDTTGKLESMNQSVGYNHDAGIEFSQEIKTEAEKLDQLPQ